MRGPEDVSALWIEHEQNSQARVYAASGDTEGFLCRECFQKFQRVLAGELHAPDEDVEPPRSAGENVCVRCGCGHHRNLYAAAGDTEGWLCEPCSDEVAAFLKGELESGSGAGVNA